MKSEIAQISNKQTEFLVNRFKKGDLSALEDLYKIYQQDLFRYLLAVTKRAEVAEDITHETFLTAFKKRVMLQTPTKFKYWLFKIGLRIFLMQERASKNHEPLNTEEQDKISRSPLSAACNKEEKEIIQHAISMLSAEKRSVLWLHIVEDIPHTEIARILNIPEGTSRSRLHGALQEMEQIIGRKIDYEE